MGANSFLAVNLKPLYICIYIYVVLSEETAAENKRGANYGTKESKKKFLTTSKSRDSSLDSQGRKIRSFKLFIKEKKQKNAIKDRRSLSDIKQKKYYFKLFIENI